MERRSKRKSYKEERVVLSGMLAEFRDALEEEIEKIEKSGQSSTLLFSGRQIESHSGDFWYQFNVEYAPSLPADTPCKLTIGKEQFDVTVISFAETSIIISSKKQLPATIGQAQLENGATVLMERLIKCIEANAEVENASGNKMFLQNGEVYQAQSIFFYNDIELNDNNTPNQSKAIVSAISNDITYIWGPPGTGKTTVIGQIIDELYKHDRSVLVVSHTNTAVDGAIEKADRTYSKKHQDEDTVYPILRLGTPAKLLPERVLLTKHIEILGKELYEQKAQLENQQIEAQRRINEIIPLLAKDAWIRESCLETIGKTLTELFEIESKIKSLTLEIETTTIELQKQKEAHPEYARYLVLSRDIKSKKDELEGLSEQIQKYSEATLELPKRIQFIRDEIRKHDVYAKLRAEEAKFMSETFLKQEISRINSQIVSLNAESNVLTARQSSAQRIIFDYERKSSVAKLFAGKSAVSQAKSDISAISLQLSQVKENLQRSNKLLDEYKQQFDALLVIQEQIKAVTPSKTQEYWGGELERIQTQLDDAQSILPGLSSKKLMLVEELASLEEHQKQAKQYNDIVIELTGKLRQKQDELNKLQSSTTQSKTLCSEMLDKEKTLCAAFYYAPTATNEETLYQELIDLFSNINKEVTTLDFEAIRQEKETIDKHISDIFRQLNELKEKMQELEKQAIANAKIVGATLAKTYLSDALRERKFDTVILDEASMASIPALWCASYLAESSIVIVGDFLQLPPIVMAETPMAQEWLGKDIFYHSGMQDRAKKPKTCPSNFVMLNDQFRMESDIADIANMYYGEYGGLISNDEKRMSVRDAFYKWYSGNRTKQHVHLVDTENLHAWVTGVPQGKSHSRLNCFSAAVDVDLAFKFLENKLKDLDPDNAVPEKEPSVLIVAPYKPHIARINQLIELEYRNRGFKENLNFIRAGTIHSFQGSEADIVIFDLVIDEPHWKANLFMTEKAVNNDLRKMFNVAVTRAKFKLFVVGNFTYCQKRAKNNALSELLDKLINKDKLKKIDAKDILPKITFTRQSDFAISGSLKGKHIVCREESFNEYFMADIRSFKQRLIVYSPFMTEARLSLLLPACVDAINEGKQIIVVTKALSDRGRTELAQYQKCEQELRDIGVNVLHKKGMHEKLIFVDSEAVWIGSLNALSFTGLTGEIMQRHADKKLTAEYEKLFDILHICGVVENADEQKCPICQGEMLLKESDEGGIYWQCTNGDYSRNAIQQYPHDGVLRCKCGAPYVYVMKNEPRWVCSQDTRHFQKMRESDLKLEKMAALIPTKAERKKVDNFFADKKKEKALDKKVSSADNEQLPLF